MQLLHVVALTIALPDTLPAPTTYLVDDVCRALYSPQSVPHGVYGGQMQGGISTPGTL